MKVLLIIALCVLSATCGYYLYPATHSKPVDYPEELGKGATSARPDTCIAFRDNDRLYIQFAKNYND